MPQTLTTRNPLTKNTNTKIKTPNTKHLKKEIQICTQNKDRTDLVLLKLLLLEIRSQKNTNTKIKTPNTKHLNKEIQICTQNKDRTDLLLLKLLLIIIQTQIQKLQTPYTEHWIKR